MAICFPFIKYFYILVLFVISFFAMKNFRTEMIGFGATFAVQTLFTLVLIFEILKDGNRADKVLTIPFPATPISLPYNMNLPLYLILAPCVSMQFVASMLMMMAIYSVYKQENQIKVSRNERWSINAYQNMFIIATFALMFLTYVYVNDFMGSTFSGTYRILILTAIILSVCLSSVNMINGNHQTRMITSTTDG